MPRKQENMTNCKTEHLEDGIHFPLNFWLGSVLILDTKWILNEIIKKREMKGKGRELEGRGRTSSYLELVSCNLLERRQERYKQKSQTDSFWL